MRFWRLAVIPVLLAVLARPAIGAEIRWLNVDVREDRDATSVQLHLPLPLVTAVLSAVDTRGFRRGVIELDLGEAEVDWVALLREVRSAPEGEYVKVDDATTLMSISKRGGTVLVTVTEKSEGGERVELRLPETILEAIDVGGGNRLDLVRLVSSLGAVGAGEVLNVASASAHVRVWVE